MGFQQDEVKQEFVVIQLLLTLLERACKTEFQIRAGGSCVLIAVVERMCTHIDCINLRRTLAFPAFNEIVRSRREVVCIFTGPEIRNDIVLVGFKKNGLELDWNHLFGCYIRIIDIPGKNADVDVVGAGQCVVQAERYGRVLQNALTLDAEISVRDCVVAEIVVITVERTFVGPFFVGFTSITHSVNAFL